MRERMDCFVRYHMCGLLTFLGHSRVSVQYDGGARVAELDDALVGIELHQVEIER